MKQKQSRYEMHKYWGKKPSPHLSELIEKFSKKGDVVLDPFSGYGVFSCEALISGRHSISHDLNPVANFIQKQLFESNIDTALLLSTANSMLDELSQKHRHWYETTCQKCGKTAEIIATLRQKDNTPIRNKIDCICSKNAIEQPIDVNEAKALISKENRTQLPIHPVAKLMRNGRISVFDNMTTDDFFTVRALECHIDLFFLIKEIKDVHIQEILLLAFTSNLANCSRLVPPIKSRGEMAPGAWMTGFYIGETYLENNVFHYFRNRLRKVIDGKNDYYESLNHTVSNQGNISNFKNMPAGKVGYIIDKGDAKSLSYPDESIDFIFTDPPYGDTVPYFEQSILWNTWLFNNDVDYANELVISDSKERCKKISAYTSEMRSCISEIHRVLKTGKFFSITFHSLAGDEWYALTHACLASGFSFYDAEWLSQKTFAPRQLNRSKTVKGDLLITFQKVENKETTHLGKSEAEALIKSKCHEYIQKKPANTNDLYIYVLKYLFNNRLVFDEINIIQVLNEHFKLTEDSLWCLAA
jgi:DNA modification methylase